MLGGMGTEKNRRWWRHLLHSLAVGAVGWFVLCGALVWLHDSFGTFLVCAASAAVFAVCFLSWFIAEADDPSAP
jgi:hypothetical protein